VGDVAVGKILLGDELVQSLALEDAELAVFEKFLNKHVGNTFADVLIGSPNRGHRGPHRSVVKIHDGDALFGRGGGRVLRRANSSNQEKDKSEANKSGHDSGLLVPVSLLREGLSVLLANPGRIGLLRKS